jgi:hypothetical protein
MGKCGFDFNKKNLRFIHKNASYELYLIFLHQIVRNEERNEKWDFYGEKWELK